MCITISSKIDSNFVIAIVSQSDIHLRIRLIFGYVLRHRPEVSRRSYQIEKRNPPREKKLSVSFTSTSIANPEWGWRGIGYVILISIVQFHWRAVFPPFGGDQYILRLKLTQTTRPK